MGVKQNTSEMSQSKGPPFKVDAKKCTGCLICELRCSLRFERAFNPAQAQIKIRRLIESRREYEISFANGCDRCGICARYCSYGALSQTKVKED
jgi:ferredoxin